MEEKGQYQKATFAAGCFWGVEAAFRHREGVIATAVGYTGGTTSGPTYEQVCSGTTGHAEAVEILFDPNIISYDLLLNLFWDCHDSTQRDRQGPDIGSNYRSAIFFHTGEQRAAAEASKAWLQASDAFRGKEIVTEIVPAGEFWMAEEYHQQFYEKSGRGFCATRLLDG
jgi:peptide-methionine (S)-S-oxide reductase